jgi:hypothetical protein
MTSAFRRREAAILSIALAACGGPAVQVGSSSSVTATSAAITTGDLRSRLFIYADDSMKGRLAGTPNNDRATAYIASELKKMGMQPGGENGTYFQLVPLIHVTPSVTKPITVDGRNFMPTKDFIARVPRAFGGQQAIYAGTFGEASMLPPAQVAGKVVVVSTPRDASGKPLWNGTRQPLAGPAGIYRNAFAVAVVGMNGMTQADWGPLMEEGIDFISDPQNPIDLMQAFGPTGFLYISDAMGQAMMGAPLAGMAPGTVGRTIGGAMGYDTTRTSARNVIGILPGSDPSLRSEYVAIGAHNDHVGTTKYAADHDSTKAFNIVYLPAGADSVPRARNPQDDARFHRILDSLRKGHPARMDSIFNGADDDGSGTVSVLEIAEAFQKSATRPKRSILFVWHTGEELGLLGSEYFTDHPTVPRSAIVAQLNMDMVGRGGANDVTGKTIAGKEIMGGPDYLQLVGSRRLSTELGDLIETVNKGQGRPLAFDYSIDANGHPANIYCRSDHYNYARYGIPITFFTTGGHSDYHQLTDEPQYIDYDKMQRVATLVFLSAERVANLDHRVVVDKPKPNPMAPCQQ